jgi:hypothetical protein
VRGNAEATKAVEDALVVLNLRVTAGADRA